MREETRASAPVNSRALNLCITEAGLFAPRTRIAIWSRARCARAPASLATAKTRRARYEPGRNTCQGTPLRMAAIAIAYHRASTNGIGATTALRPSRVSVGYEPPGRARVGDLHYMDINV